MARVKDLTNLQFNDLTAIHFVNKDKYDAAIWKFKCICGNVKNLVGSRVSKGHIKSCGCRVAKAVSKSNSNRKLPDNASSYNELYGDYKRGARKRHYEFNISLDQFKEITRADCSYCGKAPYTKFKQILFTGLDRVDSSAGYNLQNVVPCCIICNRMKSDIDVKTFIDHVHSIARFTGKI